MNRRRTFKESKRSLTSNELLQYLIEVNMSDIEIDEESKMKVSWLEILGLLIVIIITGGLIIYEML